MRVFLDANILFSAAKSDGAIRELLVQLARAGHRCVADPYVVEEARRNIQAKSPEATRALDRLLSRIEVSPLRRAGQALLASLPLPPKDRPVLAAAILAACDALVTGDQTHFGSLYGRTIDGVAIHSPRSLAEATLRQVRG